MENREEEKNKEQLLKNYRSALMLLSIQNKTRKLIKTHQLKEMRKKIARLLTKK
jgi:ribosomal protein L29